MEKNAQASSMLILPPPSKRKNMPAMPNDRERAKEAAAAIGFVVVPPPYQSLYCPYSEKLSPEILLKNFLMHLCIKIYCQFKLIATTPSKYKKIHLSYNSILC